MSRLLLVEPNDVSRQILAAAAASVTEVESHRIFETARARLWSAPFDFLVTNVRLGAYNGLHLVYVSSRGHGTPRAIVYSDERDPGLAREVRRAGAVHVVVQISDQTVNIRFGGRRKAVLVAANRLYEFVQPLFGQACVGKPFLTGLIRDRRVERIFPDTIDRVPGPADHSAYAGTCCTFRGRYGEFFDEPG